MKKYIYLMFLGLSIVITVGCGGKQMVKPTDTPSGVDEKLISSSEPTRPEWTKKEPETANGIMSFVGLSGYYATEQLARDDARRNAINNVVSYMGTLAENEFEKALVDYGLSSSTIDPTTSARIFEKQLSANIARTIKVKEWYTEKWQRPTGTGHLVFAWANVPQSAVDETMNATTGDLAKKAEQQAKEAGDEVAKKQAEKAAEFWKQMQEQRLPK